MRRSADFGVTVKRGRRAVQPDIVVYGRRPEPSTDVESQSSPPRVGLIIAKSVGSAVDRHRVARRLRHVARDVIGELAPAEQLVIRALPGSNGATSETLRAQLRDGLSSIRRTRDAAR